MLEDCGGKFEIKHGIKDCTNCLIPHRPRGYDYITSKIIKYNDERVEAWLKKQKD